MPNPVAALRACSNYNDPNGPVWCALHLWCPGCDELHAPSLPGPAGYRPDTCWEWDGNLELPTISPSILITGVQWAEGEAFHKPGHLVPAGGQIRCHSFVRGGRWEFLTDSTHHLAGQTVDMVPLPAWLTDEED